MLKTAVKDKKIRISEYATKYGTVLFLIFMFIVFSALQPSTFLSLGNLLTILRQIVILSILGTGLTVVMITGRIDLTIGYAASFLGIVAGALMVDFGVPVWLTAIITLIVGAILGSLSGVAVAFIGIPDFIATLSIGFLISGVNQAYTMMSGVNVKKNLIWSYVVSGIGAGLAALILSSRLGTAHPTAGDDYLMEALATVYVGGTAFKNGEFNIAGTFVGAMIIGVLTNGLTLCNVQYYNQDIAKGLVIFLAVTITSIQKTRKK